MSNYLPVTPESEDYLSAELLFNNLTYNTKGVLYITNVVEPVDGFPVVLALNGFGVVYIQGRYNFISESPTDNQNLFFMPPGLVPARDTHSPIVVLRAGAFVPNAVKIRASDGYVVLKTAAQLNDILCFDSVSFLVDSYN